MPAIDLKRDQRKQIEDLMLRLPNISDPAICRQLLVDLPRALQQGISLGGAPAANIREIINAVTMWEPIPGEEPPLLLLLDNAADMVRGSRTGQELQTLLATLTQAANASLGGRASSTGAARNVQTGTGTQYNADHIQGGRDAFVGSTITQNYYYPSPPAPASGQATAPTQAPTAGLHAAVKLDGPGRRQLHRALLGAYLKLDDLAQMVAFSFDENLGAVAGGDNISSVIFSLMQWAEARGRLGDLIAAAAEDRPQSVELQAIARQYGLAQENPPVSVAPTAKGDPNPLSPDREPLPYDAQDRLLQIIRETPPFLTGDAQQRVAFMRRAGLSATWIANYSWGGAAFNAAAQLVQAAANQGIPLQGRPGYTALGTILARLIEDEMVGVEDARYLARLLLRYQLIDPASAEISPTLRSLLADVRRASA